MDGLQIADSRAISIQDRSSHPIHIDLNLERPPSRAQISGLLKQYITELLYQRMFMPAPFCDLQSEVQVSK